MPILQLTGILTAPPVNISRYRFTPSSHFPAVVTPKVTIREDLKAYGSIRTDFSVKLTPTGIQVDLTT